MCDGTAHWAGLRSHLRLLHGLASRHDLPFRATRVSLMGEFGHISRAF